MLSVLKSGVLKQGLFLAVAFSASLAYADLWGIDTRLTNSSGTSESCDRSLAVSGDTVHVSWIDERSGNFAIYYKSSIDNGENWGPDDQLGVDTNPQFPAIAASGSNVHLVWSEDWNGNPEILYRRSTDNGIGWGNKTRMTNDDSNSTRPALAVWDINVHLAWVDDRDEDLEVYYKRSTNNGTNWDVDRRLTTSSGESNYPALAASGSNLHLVWCDDRDGNFEVYYKRSTNNGDVWQADTRLTNNDSTSLWAALAVWGSSVHVVWEDKRDGEREVYYKRSTDGGSTWSTDTALTTDGMATGSELHPSIAVHGSNVEVVWSDIVDGNPEIYYIRSGDNGVTWEPAERLTDEPADSYNPSIATSTYNVHLIWTDERDGNPEIYYKHGLVGELQPDNSIKNHYASVYLGDDIYNDDGANQIAEQQTRQTDTAIYHIRVENDGEIPESFYVGGMVGAAGWTITYYDSLAGGIDVTPLVEYNMLQTPVLAPGDFVYFRAEVIPDLSIPEDSAYEILITTTSTLDTSRCDAVKAITIATQTPAVEENAAHATSCLLAVTAGRTETVINYSLPGKAAVNLAVADVSGRIVRNLVAETKEPGSHTVIWDGCDSRGLKLPTGLYFAKLQTEEKILTRKFILLD